MGCRQRNQQQPNQTPVNCMCFSGFSGRTIASWIVYFLTGRAGRSRHGLYVFFQIFGPEPPDDSAMDCTSFDWQGPDDSAIDYMFFDTAGGLCTACQNQRQQKKKPTSKDFSGTQERILGFQWYAGTDIRISIVRSNGYRDFSGTQ